MNTTPERNFLRRIKKKYFLQVIALKTDASCACQTERQCCPLGPAAFFPQDDDGKEFKEDDAAAHHQRIGNGADPQFGKNIHAGINEAEGTE